MAPVYNALALAATYIPKAYHLPSYLLQYEHGVTPLSQASHVIGAIVTYLAVIFGGRELMKNREPMKLNGLFQLHNLFLTLGSGLLLVLMLEEAIPIYLNRGMFAALCAKETWTANLEFYYIINYYFKYIELIDTVFLVLKKKPLAFLHVYHHAATALLCYSQLNGKTSVSWVVISLNLLVHVIMYYYYYATAGGAKIWWKRYLTTLQITQFVIDMFVVYFGTYSYVVFNYAKQLPHYGTCAGTLSAALFGCGLLSSYLFLFIAFYRNTYKKAGTVNKVAGAKAMPMGGVKTTKGKKINPEKGL